MIFSLDFIPLGRHAPWYAALAEGYFRDEGLDVSIIPSQGTAQTIQAVESGTANIAFVDVPSVVLARANGSKLRMVAVNYQKAPYAIFSLKNGANVTRAQAARRSEPGQRRRQLHAQGDRRLHGPEGPRPEQAQDRQHRSAGARQRLVVGTSAGDRVFRHGQARARSRRQGRQYRAAHLPAQRSRARPLLQRARGERRLSRQQRRRW